MGDDGELECSLARKAYRKKPGLKRLAVQVEDHALEFAPFHEANPEGESARGRIEIWDHGTYECEHVTRSSTFRSSRRK
jgi:hypothetical protein